MVHCNGFLSLLDSGGTSVFDSGEGVANVDGEVAELYQREVVSEVGCGMRHGEAAIYSLHGVPWEVMDDDGEDGATGGLERGRGQGGAREGAGSVMSVLEQLTVVKGGRARAVY